MFRSSAFFDYETKVMAEKQANCIKKVEEESEQIKLALATPPKVLQERVRRELGEATPMPSKRRRSVMGLPQRPIAPMGNGSGA